MKIERDAVRVRALAAEKEDENWQFRRFLKGSDLSIVALDAVVHRHYEEVSRQTDCCACGNCCRTIRPILSVRDIRRLAGHLNMSDEELVRQHLERAEEEDKYTFKGLPCPFLSGNKCTVYAVRPEDCRSYPHLHKEEFVFRLMQAVENCSICPIVYNVFEQLKDELWHPPDDAWLDDSLDGETGCKSADRETRSEELTEEGRPGAEGRGPRGGSTTRCSGNGA